jgi:outer membrane receptor for ferrienterochelin and colicins
LFAFTLTWGQTRIYVTDGDTKLPINFEVAYKSSTGEMAIAESVNEVVSLNLENSQKVTVFQKDYEPLFLIAYPKRTYKVELRKYYDEIDEVIITDIHSRKNLNNTVLNISKITAEKIEELGAVDLRDALTFENNIRLSRDNAIGSAGMTMMGIGGDNVKLLIDGVPVIGRLFNQLDLEKFNLENMKQIEVIQGPMSVIYGSNALAGTINLVTNNSNTKPRANLNANYESDGQHNLTGTYSRLLAERHYVTLSGGRTMFTGWSANDIDRTFDWIPKEQYTGRVQYTYRHDDATVNVRSELIRSRLLDRGTPLAPYRETAIDQKYINQRFDNSISYNNKIGKTSLQLMAGNNSFSRIKNKYFKNLVSLDENLVSGETSQDTQTFNATVLRAIVGFNKAKTFGIETLIGFDGNTEKGTGGRIKDGLQSQLDAALFASAEKQVNNHLLLRGGIRYAYNSAFEAPLLYSLQSRVTLPNSQVLKLAYGKGFRAPSLKELYLDFNDSRHEVFGNADLLSETSHSITGSYTNYWRTNDLELATTVEGFYNDIENKIELIVTGPISAQYGNIGVFKSVGGGISQKIKGEDLSLNASFNYTGIYNGVDESGGDFFFSPQLVLNPSYELKKINTTINVFYNYFGAISRVFSDTASTAVNIMEQDAYSMFDITLNKSFLNKRLRIGVGARNILNVININSNTTEIGAHTPSTDFVSISPGRTFFISVRYEFFKNK